MYLTDFLNIREIDGFDKMIQGSEILSIGVDIFSCRDGCEPTRNKTVAIGHSAAEYGTHFVGLAAGSYFCWQVRRHTV